MRNFIFLQKARKWLYNAICEPLFVLSTYLGILNAIINNPMIVPIPPPVAV